MQHMPRKIYLLLGDVINSRAINNRKLFEKKFQSALEWLANDNADLFTIPLKQWKGIDEIAGVLKKPASVYKVITAINEKLDPEMMRFVLAKGEVDILSKTKDISNLDGPVFHEAANHMFQIKKEKWLFGMPGDDKQEVKALNTQINSLLLIRGSWTETQRKIFYAYAETGNQEKTAKKLRITQQSVSKTLRLVSAAQVLALEEQLTEWANAVFAD
jgi:ABC-type glycerol-3-phosphate transport system substrate-binding protein